jgi:plastocyanin
MFLPFAGCLLAAIATSGGPGGAVAEQASGHGTIKGHIRLMGTPPANTIIRMGMDRLCARMNARVRVVQETVVASADGSLANVFVKLQGSFPQTPMPTVPVSIDQRGCVYTPRLVGARVGQMLQVRNSDQLLHNVHGISERDNGFNISEPKAGMVQQFRLKDEEVMLRLKCDVHSWMIAFVGVVNHPYFAVTHQAGTFEIGDVPTGTYTIQAWHERYGQLVQTVRVRAGTPTTVDFSYAGSENAGAGVQDLVLPAGMATARLIAPLPGSGLR